MGDRVRESGNAAASNNYSTELLAGMDWLDRLHGDRDRLALLVKTKDGIIKALRGALRRERETVEMYQRLYGNGEGPWLDGTPEGDAVWELIQKSRRENP